MSRNRNITSFFTKARSSPSMKSDATNKNTIVNGSSRIATTNGNSIAPQRDSDSDSTAKAMTTAPASISASSSTDQTAMLPATASSPVADHPSSFKSNATQTSAVLLDSKEIRDSDEEFSASDDSDSSLEDLQDILARRRANQNDIPLITPMPSKSSTRQGSIESSRSRPKYKLDMKALVKSTTDNRALDNEIQALAEAHAAELEQEESVKQTREEMLESIVADKDGLEKSKVIKAVMRTEAMSEEQEWHFFRSDDDHDSVDNKDTPNSLEFPSVDIPSSLSLLKSAESREVAVLSGHVQDIVALGCALPQELFFWILDETYTQEREDLREAYSGILLASSTQIKDLLAPQHIDAMLGRLGGSASAIDISTQLEFTNPPDSEYIRRDWPRLSHAINLLGSMAKSASKDFCSHALQLILRLCVDPIVIQRKHLFSDVGRALIKLSGAFSDDEWAVQCKTICINLHKTIVSTPMILRILDCVPRTTPRLHDLRRRISLYHILPDLNHATTSTSELPILSMLLDHLESPMYRVNNATDYKSLAARFALFDVAIDGGNIEFSTHEQNTSLLTPPSAQSTTTSSTFFNEQIDLLVTHLKAIHRSIRDSGANHPSRTAAKTVLEGVYFRLEFAVRTESTRKRGIFDDRDEEEKRERKRARGEEAQRGFMGNFLQRRNAVQSSEL